MDKRDGARRIQPSKASSSATLIGVAGAIMAAIAGYKGSARAVLSRKRLPPRSRCIDPAPAALPIPGPPDAFQRHLQSPGVTHQRRPMYLVSLPAGHPLAFHQQVGTYIETPARRMRSGT